MAKKIVFLCMFMCMLGSIAHAQSIQSIRYIGSSNISNALASDISQISPGDTLDIQKVDEAIKRFYKQGYFSDIYADFTNGVLSFVFTQKPKVANIEISGYGSEQEREMLYSQMGIRRGDSFEEIRLERAKELIKNVLEYQGYYGSTIEEKIEYINNKEAISIILEVNRGQNIIIDKATYDGAKELSMDEIQEQSVNKEKQFMGWFWGRNNGELKLMELEYDGAKIQDSYLKRGYLDASISPAYLSADFSAYTAELYYKINEGKKYKVDGIELKFIDDISADLQDAGIDEEDILDDLSTKSNKWFNIELLRADIESIRKEVADLGYAFARIVPDLDKNEEDGKVKVIYVISAGKKVSINDVIISGNTRTADRILRRELLLAPGDIYELSKIKRSENALRRLGFFDKVTLEERRVSEDKMDLLVSVEEARTGELMFGLGYGSYDKLMLNASIRERNLFGTGLNGQIYADWSVYRQLINVSLTNPRIFDSPYSVSVSAFNSQYISYSYTEYTTGAGISVGRLLTDTLRVNLGYNISTTQLGRFATGQEEFYRQIYTIPRPLKSAISPSISFDNTDDYYFPKNGVIASAYVEYAGVGGDEKYTKVYGKSAFYYHLKKLINLDIITRYKVQAGAIYDNGYTPITSKYYMGGISTVRGYYASSQTPTQLFSGTPIRVGGNYLATNSVEISFGLIDAAQLRVALFYDYGLIGTKNFNEIERKSWGFAVEWVSPIGPIVLIFPQVINPPAAEKGYTSKFEFTMGTRF